MRTYGTATLERGMWQITADPHVAMMLKRLFKKSDRGIPGKVTLSHSPDVCRDLEWFCQRYPLDVRQLDALAAGAAQHRETVLRIEDYLGDTFAPQPYEMAIQPRTYQARSAAICLANGFLLNADEIGLGKTCSAIAMIVDPRARPAVVVTLTHLPQQWARELLKFAPSLSVHVVKKATPYPLPLFFGQGPDVIVLSYSKLAGWGAVLGKYARAVVFDEIQELRRNVSLRYQAAQALVETATYRLGLSATPIYNYGDEILNVLDILKPGVLGSREEFIREWCVPVGVGKYKLKDPRAFGSWCRETCSLLRHTRKEVGRELPPVIPIVQTIDSDAAALDRIEGDAAALARIVLKAKEDRRGEKMQAAEDLSNLLRQATGIAKAPYVADFVRLLVESGERVLLAGWHREVYGIWEAKLKGIKIVYYTGTESPTQKEESRRRFMAGEAQVMFISLRSGAGLDGLQEAAKVVVLGELDWSPGVHEQVIGRIARDGQDEPVVAYYLVAEQGADPTIAQVLGLKRQQIEGIRDPNHALIQQLSSDGDRVRQLAEAYLAKVAPQWSIDEQREPERRSA